MPIPFGDQPIPPGDVALPAWAVAAMAVVAVGGAAWGLWKTVAGDWLGQKRQRQQLDQEQREAERRAGREEKEAELKAEMERRERGWVECWRVVQELRDELERRDAAHKAEVDRLDAAHAAEIERKRGLREADRAVLTAQANDAVKECQAAVRAEHEAQVKLARAEEENRHLKRENAELKRRKSGADE